jgi:hypothetical protein
VSPFRRFSRNPTSTKDATRKHVFEKFDFSPHTLKTAETALPKGLSEREYVALALFALDQAGVATTTQEHFLKTLALDGHA